MHETTIGTYLKARRLGAGFLQQEIAALAGVSGNQVSQVEMGLRSPNGKLMVAASLLFDEPIRELFPLYFGELERELREEAARLLAVLSKKRGRRETKATERLRRLAAALALNPV